MMKELVALFVVHKHRTLIIVIIAYVIEDYYSSLLGELSLKFKNRKKDN